MNLTIVVDDDILKRARIRALEEDTSVNAVLRAYLTAYAGVDRQRRAKARCPELYVVSKNDRRIREVFRRGNREPRQPGFELFRARNSDRFAAVVSR